MAENTENKSNLDFKVIILRYWKFRWFFVVSVLVFLIAAYIHNKFSPSVYKNSMQMSIDIQENRGRQRNERFQSINFLNRTSNLENELGKMNSFNLVKSTLTNLNYEVGYYLLESPFRIKPLQDLPYKVKRELYEDAPFRVNFYRSHNQIINTRFHVTLLSDSTYKLRLTGEEVPSFNYIDNTIKKRIPRVAINKKYKFGEIVDSTHYKFYIDLKDTLHLADKKSKEYFFFFQHMDHLTLQYLRSLNIAPTSPASSLINISLTGTHPKKITEFLNRLAEAYINKDLEDKNRESKSTIEFIESQISDVASSLSYTGNTLEQFRSQHRIVDLDFQGQKMYERLNDLESRKASLLTQKKYYEEIRDYIQNNKVSALMAPSSMNINDPNLNTLISRLTELNSERKASASRSQKSLFEEDLNERIENLKNTVLENVTTNLKNIDISLDDMNYRIEKLSVELSALPSKELRYQAIKRKFELNDEIYTYLLTKRAEAQIAQASNFPAYEVVDPARNLDYSVIAPSTRMNYFIAVFAGLFLPFTIILMGDFFNNRVRTISDIEHITNLPVIGHIAHNKKEIQENGMIRFNHSVISESLRMLRTNIQILNGRQTQIILITSSSSNEGKTFSAINLALGFSLLKQNTLLIGNDLRKPKLAELLGLSNEKGMSTYLTGVDRLEDIIQPTSNAHLHVITEGPLAPNPTELIASDKTGSLFEKIRDSYSYIIIDTSPIGIVSDSKLLMKQSDLNLLMVRQGKTKKHELINTLKNLKSYQVSNFQIVLNDFSPKNDQFNYMYKYYSDQSQAKEGGYFSHFMRTIRERSLKKTKPEA
jgi:capsular exopolysaccharide synthesis family protein